MKRALYFMLAALMLAMPLAGCGGANVPYRDGADDGIIGWDTTDRAPGGVTADMDTAVPSSPHWGASVSPRQWWTTSPR